MPRATRVGAVAALAAFGATVAVLGHGSDPATGREGPANNVLAQQVDIEAGSIAAGKLPGVSGGVMSALNQRSNAAAAVAGGVGDEVSRRRTEGCRNVFQGRAGLPDNIRVNQDCTLRRQAEEAIEADPNNQSNLLAMQNDNLIGFNHCGYDWSFNTGRTWGSQAPPFYQYLFETGDTADACSDPTVGWDTQGNSYIGGVFFEVADVESAVLVMKSNAPLGGTAFHTPVPQPFQEYLTTPAGEVVSSADENIFHDKELMEVDNHPTSPKKDNVYMTWTMFEINETEVGGRSPIMFSQSTDGGATWSEPIVISGSSAVFCRDFSGTPGNPNACDQDQGSHPIAGPDGTIYVAFGNGNTPELGINQVLMVSCPATEDCVDEADWRPPTRVGDLIGTHPIGDPDNPGGCPVGRQCLPPNGYRVPEFTSISIANHGGDDLTVAWADFRNGDDPGSTCGPLLLWTEAEPPCNNDVFYASSADGGATWSPTHNVTPPPSHGQTAQWQPWHDAIGGTAYVMYYDRQYGNCESAGCNDITLAAIEDALTATPTIRYRRITTSSMPNLTPATNPVQAGFLGDYPWVDAVERTAGGRHSVHLVWADTRPTVGEAPEEDVYYARMNCTRRGICDPVN